MRNDVSALTASFRENYQDLLRFLTRRTGDADSAAALAEDTYLRLTTVPSALEIENPRAFVYRVAGNLAIDALRREGRLAPDLTFLEAGEAAADGTLSPEASALARDRLRQLEEALDELPAKARTALLLNRVEGRPFVEIAGQLGVSESMVAKYIARALRHCRDRLRLGE